MVDKILRLRCAPLRMTEWIRSHHAVTHVFVSDAARGYAVSIQDMLRAAGLTQEKAA